MGSRGGSVRDGAGRGAQGWRRPAALSIAARRPLLSLLLALVAIGLAAPAALASFPFVGTGTPQDPSSWKLAPGETVTNLGEGLTRRFAATPVTPPAGEPLELAEYTKLNAQEDELCGVTGMSITDANATMPAGTNSCIAAGTPIHTAFQVDLGRPDVTIAETDSGIEWDNRGAMLAVRAKYLLNAGELPAPKVDMTTTFDPSTHVDCASARAASGGDYNRDGGMPGGTPGGSGPIPYDVLEQGVFNVLDYACDSRVADVVEHFPACTNPPTTRDCRNGPAGTLTPEDLIIAFSDGIDQDGNGFVDDIAGWNFVDNNNDPYDEVHYGHGTGEVQDSAAEADGAGASGTCPNCEIMELRVGESFVADGGAFAQAVLYASDRGVSVVQEPLGTITSPRFAREAVEYAYGHGVAVMASAADEAAEHHNQPSSLPDMIVVNSVRGPDTIAGQNDKSVNTSMPPSWLQLNGCTNFGSRIDLAVESVSCSSEATGKSAGVAGLIYSAALNACGAPLYGTCSSSTADKLKAAADCVRVDGNPCPITANEVRQLLASGNIAGTPVNASSALGGKPPSSGAASADQGAGGQADDIDTAVSPETACSVGMAPGCTDPNLNTAFAADENGGIEGNLPDTFRYPSRRGWDEFFGYGRLDAYKSVQAASEGWVPPQADITSPEWFTQLDPAQPAVDLRGYVNARSKYTCRVEVAPGVDPNNAAASAGGDFAAVPSTYCDGKTIHGRSFSGLLASLSSASLQALFPKGDPTSFTANENGGPALKQSSNGRPNSQPYAFTVRVVVSTAAGVAGPAMTGEDRRQLFLHRDAEMAKGLPLQTGGDGDASPLLVDLAGSDTNQLVLASSDGWIHAYRYDPASGGLSDLPGWPVHTDPLPVHAGEHAFASGALSSARYAPVLSAPAAGDLLGDGEMDIVVDDLQGNVYAWNAKGQRIFHARSNPAYSGAPLAGDPAWEAQRQGVRQRTESGFVSSPVLADLEPQAGRGLDIVAAGEDRHLYAWHADGEAVKGFPVLVEDPDKVASVDPQSNQPTFNSNVPAGSSNKDEDQGKIIDTPAVAALDGPGKPPSIVVGTNEEYLTEQGDEGALNASPITSTSLGVLGQAGLLNFANSRVYAIKSTGCSSDSSSCATGGFQCAQSRCTSVAFRDGWPVKVALINAGLLPDVGEGINGSPVAAPIACPEGGQGMKVAVTPDAGAGYVLNADGSSCYGSAQGKDNTLDNEFGVSAEKTDTPTFPAVGEPAFGTLDGTTTDVFDPTAGLLRALDVLASDYQKGSQDFIGAWNANSGQFSPGFPAVDNDLSFLTGESVGDVTGEAPKQEVVAGTASNDVVAFGPGGLPASGSWPKLSGDWLVATPVLGSLGTLDTAAGARKDVVTMTRSGTLSVYTTPAGACSPSSWPSFHHDIANSGDYTRDAVPPGVPLHASVANSVLSFTAPGDDLMCGTASGYEVVTSATPITPASFAAATPIPGAPTPAAAGTTQTFALPSTTKHYVAIRAVDDQGNVGLPAVTEFNSGPPLPALGRCVKSPTHQGEWTTASCVTEAGGSGAYAWQDGPGAARRLHATVSSTSIETVGKAKITCGGGSLQGEYTGSQALTATLRLSGCADAQGACQSATAAPGEIASETLQGTLGLIRGGEKPSAGVALTHAPALASFECASAAAGGREVELLEGAVIGTIQPIDRMASSFTLAFKARAGKQLPEAFEGASSQTLTLTSVAGLEKRSEGAGLTSTASIADEEALEIKAAVSQ